MIEANWMFYWLKQMSMASIKAVVNTNDAIRMKHIRPIDKKDLNNGKKNKRNGRKEMLEKLKGNQTVLIA